MPDCSFGGMGELRYAVRVLLKSPLTTAAAVLSLALGIGANTALFTVGNALLFKPLPGGVVNVYVTYPDGAQYGTASWAEYLEYRKRSRSFEGLIAWNAENVHIGVDGKIERVLGTAISTNYFAGLGVEPVPGRALRDGEENERVAVISHAFWLEKFNGRVDAIGRQIQINDKWYTIVGVAPRQFWGLEADGASVWFPGAADSVKMAGRLRPGVTPRSGPGGNACPRRRDRARQPQGRQHHHYAGKHRDAARGQPDCVALRAFLWGSRSGAGDRLRECGQPAPGEGVGPATRNRRTPGAWCRAWKADPADAR